ncbi:MAG: hypothetical protein M1825_004328 [Sarcosagium campestre]|nr:MAG: hypothetical protein M1825_004328 [Sarcosagium campestre]
MSRPSSHLPPEERAASPDSIEPTEPQRKPPSTRLETLIEYLLASKRSLTLTEHVWRANELVTSARAALEQNAVLNARTGFLRREILQQVDVLRLVKLRMDAVARDRQTEFEVILRDLDITDARLQRTLDMLQSTPIERTLQPKVEEQLSLLDFVEEEGVDSVKSAIRESIDKTQESRQGFESSISRFNSQVGSITTAISANVEGFSPSNPDAESPVPNLLFSLESQAKDMAESLESLVRHFDLCVNAIKHTEGGGAVARSIAGDTLSSTNLDKLNNDDDNNNNDNNDNNDDDDEEAPIEEIGEDEMAEMLDVLEKDAADLDDVVTDIKSGLVEMEAHFEHLTAYITQLGAQYSATTAAYGLLVETGLLLPKYIASSQEFIVGWDEERQKITERMQELEALRDFYDGFLQAYDGLIIEIGRRRGVQVQMESIVKGAMTELEELYKADRADRDTFRQDQGEYLPADIWPGLTEPPPTFSIQRVDPDVADVPDIPPKLLDQALRRANTRL